MQLPHGTPATGYNGYRSLNDIGEHIARESLTGYLRVSVFDRSAVREHVIVYRGGSPVLSYSSVGTDERRDPDRRQIEEALRRENAIVEVCQLQDRQVKLLQDLYRELAPASAPAVGKAVAKEPPKAAAPRKAERPQPAPVPEVRGRFVRAADVADLDEYLQQHPGETGRLLFVAQLNGRTEEFQIIVVKGRIEAAYNGSASGAGLLRGLAGVPGLAEFYAVDEALLASIVGRYARSTGPSPAERPAPVIGISARELLEGSSLASSPAREDINRLVDEVSGGMDDDVAMVRRVERDFAGHVDELLNKLELSHLRSRRSMR